MGFVGNDDDGKMALMAEQMFRLLFSDGTRVTLGEATSKAKAATGDPDVRRSWILFGDPSMNSSSN